MSRPDQLPPLSARRIAGLLGDGERLRVVAAVALGAGDVAEVVERTGLDQRAATTALERLVGAGLVVVDDHRRFAVAVDRLKAAAADPSGGERPPGPSPEDAGATAEQAAVLRNFWRDGRLTSIPAQRGKRLVLLDFLAQRFEPGKVYPERDVNFELMKVHPDAAALRRYLVDEGFFERRDGFYWRSGGTFDV